MALTSAQQKELNSYGALKSDGSVDFDRLNQVNGLSKPQNAQTVQATKPPTIKTVDTFKQQRDYINEMKEAQQKAQLERLAKARDSSISNLNSERAKIQPLYYNKRNETSTGSQLQAKNFAEYMAQRGQSNAGASGQAELARNVALQGNIGRLNQDEANAFTENDRMVTNVNNAYENDVAAANANIDAQALQNLLNAYQSNLDYQRNQANLDRQYNYQLGRDAVSDNRYNQQWDYQLNRDYINDTGLLNGNYTLAAQQALAAIQGQNLNNQSQYINNQYLPQILQGQITGQQLSNESQMIANKYAPAIAQGQIDMNKAQLTYQNLVNQGYPQSLALDNALKQAQINNTNKNTSLMGVKSSGGSSGGSSSKSATAQKNDAKTQLFLEMQSYINNGEYERAKDILTKDRGVIEGTFGSSTYKALSDMFWDSQQEY